MSFITFLLATNAISKNTLRDIERDIQAVVNASRSLEEAKVAIATLVLDVSDKLDEFYVKFGRGLGSKLNDANHNIREALSSPDLTGIHEQLRSKTLFVNEAMLNARKAGTDKSAITSNSLDPTANPSAPSKQSKFCNQSVNSSLN